MKTWSKQLKKVLSLVMVFAMLLALAPMPARAAESSTTLYLKPNSNWTKDNARFAAYFFGNGEKWVSMTDSDGDGIYEVEAPSGYPKVIFCRMNPATTANNWNNKWNQTGDLTIPTDGKNQFTVPNGAWNGSTSSWSKYVHVDPVFTIAGTISPAGWSPENGEKLTKDNGYSYTYENVKAGDYKFKVTNGTWDNAWPSSNYAFEVAETGSTVTITFNPSSKAITVNVVAPVKEYSVTFQGTNVTSSNTAAKVKENESYITTLTAAEGYTLPETIQVTGGTAAYNKDTGVLTITNITGNVTITAVGVEIPTEPETITVYFQNNWKWSDVSIYYWGSTTASNPDWPGVAMAKIDNDGSYDIYAAQIPADVTALIINGLKDDGSGNRDQTPNIKTGIADGKGWKMNWNNGNIAEDYVYSPAQPDPKPEAKDYYLVGCLNNADYSGDNYKFEDGKLTVTFTADSYVAVKDSSGDWYLTESYCTDTTGTFAKGNEQKMFVPGNVELTFTLTENADGTLTLSYEKGEAQEPADATYILAGSGMFGTEWDPSNTDNQMTLNTATGLYEKTYSNVVAGSYEFKVTDGTWTNSWGINGGQDNYKLELKENSNVTITFNAETKEITVTVVPAEGGEDEPGDTTTYTAIFHFANTLGWSPVNLYTWGSVGTGSWPGAAVTTKDDNGYYTMTLSWEAEENAGLNYIFNNGSSQTADLKLGTEMFDEETNTAEVWIELDPAANSEGKYTIKRVEKQPFDDILLAVSPRIDGTSVTFEFAGDSSTTSVEVRGNIPGASWEKGIAMTKNAKGLWTVTVDDLDPGIYGYKFFVNGKDWNTDPANGKTDADGNSTFTILDSNAVDTNIVNIHVFYDRADGIYSQNNVDGAGVSGTWNLHVWGDSVPGTRYDFAADTEDLDGNSDTDQMVSTITVKGRDTSYVAMKPRMSTATKDWLREETEVRVNLDNIVSGTINVYVNSDGQNGLKGNLTYSVVPSTNIVTANKVTNASYDYEKNAVVVTMLEALDDSSDLTVEKDGEAVALETVKASGTTYTLPLAEAPALGELSSYKVKYDGYTYDISVDDVYATDKFAAEYTYKGKDLGATWTAASTTFRVWAPTASAVSVKLYHSGTKGTDDLIESVPMTAGANGTWVVTVDGNLNGTYYTYAVTLGGETVEAVDPYARATGVNGNRGMVIDLDSTDPTGWSSDTNPNKVTSQTDAVIYELHVRDFSIDASSGMTNKGKYLAFTEEGTKTPNGTSTGIDYLADLGITHLHLLPVYDYGSVDETKLNTPQFNWGYDPVNYNVPEGSYSTNPYDGATRVKEFKQMVKSLHDHDISVVMDVVYNHVYNADQFCFNNIVPGYFSRPNSNTSGCGNDTASEREMVRKYIVESVLYWHQEYHIDGFRFDLVGLLDVQTINEIVTEVHKCCPDVIFYGEGWDMDGTNKEPGTEMAKQHNSSKTPGFAYFSDSMRNNLAGDNGKSTGFASGAGNGSTIVGDWMAHAVTWGSVWTKNPQQVVQYASCHDNHTLADKLIVSTKANGVTPDIIKMNNLAAAFYMTSQGVPFIHAGEEFLREKQDESGKRIENSYNASDYVNHLDWTDLETYADNVEYYKGLIAFRAANPALRYSTAQLVADNVRNVTTEGKLLVYRVDANGTASTEDKDILVIFNANKSAQTVALPDGQWTIYVHGDKAGTESLGTATGSVNVAGISAMMLTQLDEGKDAKDPVGPSGEKTLYFSNNKHWSTVYAYAWTNSGETMLLGAWPGAEMTYVETNDYGEKIFSVTLPASETGIEGVIFHNNAAEQTVDIEPGVDGTGYYCTDKNDEGKYLVGTYTYRAPQLGSAEDYYLVGYINNTDYAGVDYKFVDGKVTTTFSADSYVYVVNGDNSETYMTDGYQGAVFSAILKDTAKHPLTGEKWDKLLIPGGDEVIITMVKNDDNTITLSYQSSTSAFEDQSGIQAGVTLHCWNWSFDEIAANMETIADMGYTAIQTSPIQPLKEATNGADNTVGGHWWVYYQPVDFVITTDEGNALGTKKDFEEMCAVAEEYGIQVIVDVVANHLANTDHNDLSDKIPEEIRNNEEYWHDIKTNITDWNDRYDMTQHCMGGLPDLNTGNDEIQQMVLAFLKECVDAGADGFRFDAAKSIETPKDDESFASDFWPTVVDGIREYAGEKDLYIYGEILDDPKIAISAYTQYMSVTDNGWGNHLRSMMASGNVTMSTGYYKSAPASSLVIWAESHDTYADKSSSGVSEANINKTWALIAARDKAMGLYFARPESLEQKIGVASVTGWANPEVKAVNDFHNAFHGQSETIGNINGISYVVRGDDGIVLVDVSGKNDNISISVPMTDGIYFDQISGTRFTVENGTITGTIGDTDIAVVYNYTGWYTDDNGTTYLVNSEIAYTDTVATIDGDVYLFDENGYIEANAGLVRVYENGEAKYYYFGCGMASCTKECDPYKAQKNVNHWVENTNDLLPKWDYIFGIDGVITHDDALNNTEKQHHEVVTYEVEGKNVKYYTIDGIKVHMGLFIGDGGLLGEEGEYYYARSSGALVAGQDYWISESHLNGVERDGKPVEDGSYTFDEEGRIVWPVTTKNGIYEEGEDLYYYVEGKRTYAGLIRYTGTSDNGTVYDNDLIYVRTNGQLATGRYWITKTNDLMPEQAYQFDEYGRMVLDSGFKTVDGIKYYYKNGMPFYAGLIEADGAYYYVKTSGEVITNRNYWITKTNGLVPEASYAFDADGKMLNAPGKSDVAEDFTGIKDGYYYKNGAITYAGLIEIDGNYYYVRTNGQVATGRYWITKTNNLMKAGSYQFDDNGVMLNPAK